MTRDIAHRFQIAARPEAVLRALTQESDIRAWWTQYARVRDGKGIFDWPGHGWTVELDMHSDPAGAEVLWMCTRSNMQNTDAWEGTRIRFVLRPQAGGTELAFTQSGYRDSPCFEACDQGWLFFLGTSLKRYLETGRGIPYPEMLDTAAPGA